MVLMDQRSKGRSAARGQEPTKPDESGRRLRRAVSNAHFRPMDPPVCAGPDGVGAIDRSVAPAIHDEMSLMKYRGKYVCTWE